MCSVSGRPRFAAGLLPPVWPGLAACFRRAGIWGWGGAGRCGRACLAGLFGLARRFPGRLSPLAVPGAAAVFAGAGFRSPGLGGNGALSACARVEAGLGLRDVLEGRW